MNVELVGAITGVIGLAIGALGSTFRFGGQIGKIEASLDALKNNGISQVKQDVKDLRTDFREFRKFVIEKLT